MINTRRRAAVLGSILLGWALLTALPIATAQAQSVKAVNAKIDKLLSDHASFADAFKSLQSDIGDGAKMAMGYDFPMTIAVDGKDVVFETKEAFLAGYDALVTPEIVKVVKAQKYKDVLVTSKGVMFGSGQLWINQYCNDGETCEEKSWDISAVNHGGT